MKTPSFYNLVTIQSAKPLSKLHKVTQILSLKTRHWLKNDQTSQEFTTLSLGFSMLYKLFSKHVRISSIFSQNYPYILIYIVSSLITMFCFRESQIIWTNTTCIVIVTESIITINTD